MKKIFLMFLTAGLFSFGLGSCDSRQEGRDQEQIEATEDETDDAGAVDMEDPDMEEEADEAHDSNDKNDPR
ncbi:MAG: hypothetical protein ACO1OF_01535 [Adhaeribacter sp.]